MAKLLKLRRGTTSQHGSFTGAEGEVTVDTDKETLVVHDGSTAGGHAVAAEDMANVSSANIIGRLATGSIVTSLIGDANVSHAKLQNDCVDGDNIGDDVINSEHIAAGAVDLEHMSSESVDEDNLKISNSGTNGNFLQKQSGNAGGLTWAVVSTDLVADTTPQLGGHLDVNTKNITFGDSSDGATDDVLTFGAGTDLSIYSNGTNGVFQGDIEFNGAASDIFWDNSDNLLWFKTSSQGAQSAKAWFGDGSSYGNLEISKTTSGASVVAVNTDLYLQTSTSADVNVLTGKDINFINTTGVTNYYMRCKENSGSDQCVELYYGNTPTKRLETTSTGVAVTGALTATDITLSGNLTVNGTTTTVATTNTTITDNLLELNSGASSNANDSGILIERGSTGDNAIIAWDESADKFVVGTTTATNDATGDLTIATGTLVANVEGNVTGNTSGSAGSCTGNAAGLTGTPNIAVGTISTTGVVTVAGGEGSAAVIELHADEGDDDADKWKIRAHHNDEFQIHSYSTGSWVEALTIDGSGNIVGGAKVSDSKGDLRSIPQNTQGSTYTLVASDAGKHILASGTVTVPNAVFAAGDAVTIVNNTGSTLNITQGSSVTMYEAGTANTGNRTVAQRGIVTLLFTSSSACYLSGAGMS